MEVNIDLNKINTKRKFHKLIKKSFKLKGYYDNLDSFYDLLSPISYDLTINVYKNKLPSEMDEYFLRFYKTLNYLTTDNNKIKVNYFS